MNSAPSPVLATAACAVRFAGRTARVSAGTDVAVLQLPVPVLAGAAHEVLLASTSGPATQGDYTLFAGAALLAGFAVAPAGLTLEAATVELYRQLFEVTAGRHLYRVWNYVPAINAHEGGLENYGRFCRGRALAFESRFGPGFQRRLPAASAVGTPPGPLALGFVAGLGQPLYVENPLQLPAFEYPTEYGPRSPSFSRATVAENAMDRRIFISGTAAIRGHLTVAPDELDGQLACTLENLRLIGRATGGSRGLEAGPGRQRTFKVYLRRPADLARITARLERELLVPTDTVSYLHADICRADLLLEIEATLVDC